MSRVTTATGSSEEDPYKGRPLGRVLIKLGKLQREQVHQALARQADEKQRGFPILLGVILVEMELCTQADVDLALRLQRGEPPPPPPNHN